MSYISDISKTFGFSAGESPTENFLLFKAKFVFDNFQLESAAQSKLTALLEIAIKKKIKVYLEFRFPHADLVVISSGNLSEVAHNLTELCEKVADLEKDEYTDLTIRIDKETSNNILNVFDPGAFKEYLNDITLEESLKKWTKYDFNNPVQLNVWDDFEDFQTGSIIGSSCYPTESNIVFINKMSSKTRQHALENRDKCSHFANAAQMPFVPEDFLIEKSHKKGVFSDYFQSLNSVFCIIFLADFSSIENSQLKLRLKGYKLISEIIEFDALKNTALSELKEIYEWSYLDGNYVDKIGLSRNVISIHLQNESILSIEKGTSNSVRSGYDLYLKENVKQYIEIKNKISEFIQSQSDKASDIPKGMFASFKTGLWTFTTFFISVFLLRAVGKGEIGNVVSFEVMLVGLLLIVFSIIFLFISWFEVRTDTKRLLGKYEEIRNRYKDLLNHDDLNKILNVEDLKSSEEKYIKGKRNKYAIAWFITDMLLAAVIIFLYCSNISPK